LGFGFRVEGKGLWVSGVEFRISGFGFRVYEDAGEDAKARVEP
jgi:hypothetical protein